MPTAETVRIAALSDIHYAKSSQGSMLPLFTQITEHADVLVLAGDLTDYGYAEEARILARDLTAAVKIPIVAVLGNHDLEADEVEDVTRILTDAGVHMLDGDTVEIHGVGFAGVKGFAGGFGRGALGPWGEKVIKLFVQEALDEALKLESALNRLQTATKIAVLHYAPIRDTVEGEPVEIDPWLGSSRLEEPLSRFGVTAAVHGHAHKGAPEGRTSTGIPVYNVAVQVLRENFPDRPTFRMIEVPRAIPASPADGHSHGRRATDREPVVTRVPERATSG